MALTERSVIGGITILADGILQIREDRIIERDGVEIARTYHRHALEPGESVAQESPRVRSVANVLWTPDVIEEHRRRRAERRNPTLR